METICIAVSVTAAKKKHLGEKTTSRLSRHRDGHRCDKRGVGPMIRRLLALALLLPAVALATCPSDPYGTLVCADAPTHWYRMDATSFGSELDIGSGTQTNISIVQFTSFSQPGIPGSAPDTSLHIDNGGDSATTAAATNSDFRPNATNGAGWSSEFWINPISSSGYIADVAHNTDGSYGWLWYDNAGVLQTVTKQSDCGGDHSVTTAGSIPTGSWHHIVVTTVGSGTDISSLKQYVDGALAADTTSFTGSTICVNDARPLFLRIGHFPTTSANVLDADFDEIAFYNYALSSTQVAAHHNTGITAASGGKAGMPFSVKRDLDLWLTLASLGLELPHQGEPIRERWEWRMIAKLQRGAAPQLRNGGSMNVPFIRERASVATTVRVVEGVS